LKTGIAGAEEIKDSMLDCIRSIPKSRPRRLMSLALPSLPSNNGAQKFDVCGYEFAHHNRLPCEMQTFPAKNGWYDRRPVVMLYDKK